MGEKGVLVLCKFIMGEPDFFLQCAALMVFCFSPKQYPKNVSLFALGFNLILESVADMPHLSAKHTAIQSDTPVTYHCQNDLFSYILVTTK